MAKNLRYENIVIPNGQTEVGVNIQGNRQIIGFVTPAALTSTSFSFKATTDGGENYLPVYIDNTLYSVTVAASRFVALNPNAFHGVRAMKIVAGSAEAAARTIQVVTGEIS